MYHQICTDKFFARYDIYHTRQDDPYILVLPTIKVNKIILTENDTGLALLSYPDEEFRQHSASLTSAALTGIGELIKEISGKKDIPPKLGYADYTISVYQGEMNTFYTISNGEHPLLDGLMSTIIADWDREIMDGRNTVSSDLVDQFNQSMLDDLTMFLVN